MSLAILEFMCAGLAILTSNRQSVCTALDVGVTGLTYEYGDVDGAVDNLRLLVRNVKLRRSLGTKAMRVCRERHTLDETNRLFLERVVCAL